jgi:hypothetical protein
MRIISPIFIFYFEHHLEPDLHQLSNNLTPIKGMNDNTPADNGADIFFRFVNPDLYGDAKVAADFVAAFNANCNPAHFPPNFASNFDASRDGYDDDWDC